MGRTGVTLQSPKRLVFDAGEIRVNYGEPDERSLGATRDGATLTITRVFRDPTADGLQGKRVKGWRRLLRAEAQLQVTLLEHSTENLLVALPGATAAGYPDDVTPTHDAITGGPITDASYLKNVALLANKRGTSEPYVVILKNVLADGNLQIQFQDENEAGIPITFLAFYDPQELDKEPWEIRNPKETP